MIDHEDQLAPPLPTSRRRRLIGISLLPAAATLGNLVCGALAILCCLLSMRAEYAQELYNVQPSVLLTRLERVFPTHIAAGAYLIVLAMLFDALDGRLARMTRRTSEFGAQLDSLSDVVSFGIAPAALFVTLLLRPEPGAAPEPGVSSLLARVGMLCALLYISCATIRLARFNAENVRSSEAQRAFSGLPSPGAAAAVIALLALHEQLRNAGFGAWGWDWANLSRWMMAGTMAAVGLLMVSRFDYVHVFNVYFRRRRPPTHLLGLIPIIGLWFYSFELLLVVLAAAYVLSGPIVTCVRRRARPEADPPPAT